MKLIPLSQGLSAIVDDDDYGFLIHWDWYATSTDGRFYAARREKSDGKYPMVYMHRVIAGAVDGQLVDHKDGNTLNNARTNLRLCSNKQNIGNSRLNRRNTSGFKGVRKRGNSWVAIVGGDRDKYIGTFPTPTEAAKAYDDAAVERYGEFARTNKSLGLLS